ncbi:MAG: phage regulatory CII family protein [Pseudomonadota bacterium]
MTHRPKTLGEVIQDTVLQHPEGVAGLAQELGKAMSTTYNMINPDIPTHRLTFADLLVILRRYRGCGSREILARMAADIDCMVLPIPSGTATTPDLFRHVAKVSRECGEAVGVMADALADGKLSAKEREKAKGEVHDALEALGGLYHALATDGGR